MVWETEDIIKRVQAHKGVIGTIIINSEGIPTSTFDNSTTIHYASLFENLVGSARNIIRDLDPTDELTFLRVCSKKHEIMVNPDKDFTLIVMQDPHY